MERLRLGYEITSIIYMYLVLSAGYNGLLLKLQGNK